MSEKENTEMLQNVTAEAISTLNQKYIPFVMAYVASGSITEASEKAKVTRQTGCRWLKQADVQQMIIDKRNALAIKAEVEAGAIVKELKSLAFSNIEDYMTDEGKMKPLSEIGNTAAIQEVIVHDKVIGSGENQKKERVTKIKLVDKLGALKQLSDNLNLFADNSKGKKTIINFNGIPDEVLRKLMGENKTIDISHEETK